MFIHTFTIARKSGTWRRVERASEPKRPNARGTVCTLIITDLQDFSPIAEDLCRYRAGRAWGFVHRLAGRDIDVHFEILLYFLQLSDQTTGSKSIYSLISPSICRIWNLYTSRVVPPAPSLSLLPVAEYNLSVDCDILATTIWQMLSRLVVKVARKWPPGCGCCNFGAVAMCRHDKASQVRSCSRRLPVGRQWKCSLCSKSTPLSPPNPRSVAPKRQSNHDTASVVISDICLFANSVASPHRVIAPPKSWVHSRLAHR